MREVSTAFGQPIQIPVDSRTCRLPSGRSRSQMTRNAFPGTTEANCYSRLLLDTMAGDHGGSPPVFRLKESGIKGGRLLCVLCEAKSRAVLGVSSAEPRWSPVGRTRAHVSLSYNRRRNFARPPGVVAETVVEEEEPVSPSGCSRLSLARWVRCAARQAAVGDLANFAPRLGVEGSLAGPRQRLVHVSGFQYPKTANVLLGF